MEKLKVKNKKLRFLKAFSLAEMMVSMAIIAVLIPMLSNVMITSIIVSQKSFARSFVREELASITEKIAADLRSATTIVSCQGDLGSASCQMITNETITWTTCLVGATGNLQVCKKDANGNVVYASSPSVKITKFTFEQGFDVNGTSSRKNILLTIVASHVNQNFKVQNVLLQTSISTRNYFLIPT